MSEKAGRPAKNGTAGKYVGVIFSLPCPGQNVSSADGYKHRSHRRRSISPYKPRRRSERENSRDRGGDRERARRSSLERAGKYRRRHDTPPYERRNSNRSKSDSTLYSEHRQTQ